jgi:hypothetical protein
MYPLYSYNASGSQSLQYVFYNAARQTGGLNFQPSAEKAKACQCFLAALAAGCEAPGFVLESLPHQ